MKSDDKDMDLQSVDTTAFNLDALRTRLQNMTEAELLQFGKATQVMCSREATRHEVRGVAGIAALFPVIFREFPRYYCRRCDDFHNSDDSAEWMLLGGLDRAIAQFDFDQLHMRLTHPKRSNEFISSGKDASQPQSSSR